MATGSGSNVLYCSVLDSGYLEQMAVTVNIFSKLGLFYMRLDHWIELEPLQLYITKKSKHLKKKNKAFL